MKCIFAIMVLLLGMVAHAELLVLSNATFCRFCSSYFYPLNCAGMYEDSGRYMYWAKSNIHCYEDSRSGGSIQEANENRLERRGLAEWANGSQYWGEIWIDANGGYDSNGVRNNVTNTLNSPGLFFNGTTYTNEGGWAQSHAGLITWFGGGEIRFPGQNTTGCAAETRNNAMTNVFTVQKGLMSFDMWHVLDTVYNWSNDIQNDTDNLRLFTKNMEGLPLDKEHPGAAGALCMAVVAHKATMDTNVNTCIIDYTGGTVALTNHVFVSGVTTNGNSISFNWLADRHSGAWDCPDGTITNDASGFFSLNPSGSNAIFEVIRFTNVPPDKLFFVFEDGSNIMSVTSQTMTNGVNLFAVTRGALWAQRKEVLGRVRDKRGCDRVTLTNFPGGLHIGEVGYDNDSQGWWDTGPSHRGDQLISDLAPNISMLNSNDVRIWAAALPTNHVFTFQIQNNSSTLPAIWYGIADRTRRFVYE